jgi:hypothetical protein
VSLVVGVLLANFFYRAAIAQAIELARNIWVGCDLYRSETRRQMNVEMPPDLQEERALWQRLAQRLGNLEPPVATPNGVGEVLDGTVHADEAGAIATESG